MNEQNCKVIGFVGLGNMGQPMSRNLLAAGFRVRAYDRRPCASFIDAGGEMAGDASELAPLKIIVLSLPNAIALRETVDALLPECAPGQIVIDLSSHALEHKREHAARLAERGVVLLDCEISGLPFQAASRKAVIFQSGDAQAIERAEPVFRAMAEQYFNVGPFGAATYMKLIANTMVCVHNLMAAEALNLGARAGLSPEMMVRVLGPSAAGSVTFNNKAPLMLARSFDEGKGPFRHMFGYLSRVTELAAAAGARTALLDAAHRLYAEAEAQGRHNQDIAAIIELVESGSGRASHHGE